MKNSKDKKRFHLPIRAYVLYLVIISVILTGVTLSRYTASSGGSDTARVAKMYDIKVTESGNSYKPGVWTVAPGADIIKNAVVDFGGSEMRCYVFLEITAGAFEKGADETFTYTDPASGKVWMKWSVADGWLPLEKSGGTYVYYRIVEPKTQLSAPVISDGGRISVSESITASALARLPSDLSLDINASAVQYGFDGSNAAERALAAFNAVQNK